MIREIKHNEIEQVLDIWLNTNIEAHNFIDSQYWINNKELVATLLPQATIYVYEVNSKIVGFIGVVDNFIAGLFIKSNYQGKGIGKALLDYCKNEYNNLTLEVYLKNKQAVDFYIKNDFEVIDKSFFKPANEEEYTMKWSKE